MTEHTGAQATSFAGLLRTLRIEAGLTQETLAERVEMSVRGIQDLERGVTKPQRETVRRLSAALPLTPDVRIAFETAGAPTPRRRGAASDPPSPGAQAKSLPPLPSPFTPLIGRQATVMALLKLLRIDPSAPPGARLVTLTGPGGIGKTRLALHVAGRLDADFPDGVIYVPLASIRDPAQVAATVMHSIGLTEEISRPAADQVNEFFLHRHSLLVLDNFEHVLDAAPFVLDLLIGSPALSVLVTSRAPLHVRGEFEFAVPPLGIPPPDAGLSEENALSAEFGAVALFTERARMARRDFELTVDSAPIIVEICKRLDGLPLAIELAAARIKFLPLPELLTRLDHRLGLLTGGARDLPERQQTMRAAIAWSYDRLDPGEQALFRRLSVFVGGCSLSAIHALSSSLPVSEAYKDSEVGDEVLIGVASLVDNSLLAPANTLNVEAGGTRLVMLETIREYGLECLEAHGEANLMRRRHAEFFLALAEQVEPELTGAGQGARLDLLELEHDNLRAALDWAQRSDADLDGSTQFIALRLAGALWRFWYLRGHLAEGSTRLRNALESTPVDVLPLIRAKAYLGAGGIETLRGDHGRAAFLAEQSLTLYQACDDARGAAAALNVLGIMAADRGDYVQALDLFGRNLALVRDSGVKRDIAAVLGNMGIVAARQKHYARATLLYEEAIALHQAVGNIQGVAVSMTNLALVVMREGEAERARELYRTSLLLHRRVGNSVGIIGSISGLATVALVTGEPVLAATLLGAAETLRNQIGMSLTPDDRDQMVGEMAAVKALIDEELFARAWESGRAMSIDEVAGTVGAG